MVGVERPLTVGAGIGLRRWTRLLRSLLPWWLGLFLVIAVIGEIIVRADHGFVLRTVDFPVHAELQPTGHRVHAAAAVVTWLGAQPVVLIVLTIFAAGLYRRRADLAAALVVIVFGADGLTTLGKIVVQRMGPAHRLTSGLSDYAFPSGHSTAAAALFVGATLLFKINLRAGRAGDVLVGLAVLVAIAVASSRLVLDVHWLTDVCAGFVVGVAWAVLVVRVVSSDRRTQPARRGHELSFEPSAGSRRD